jgi:hypothetical protein
LISASFSKAQELGCRLAWGLVVMGTPLLVQQVRV